MDIEPSRNPGFIDNRTVIEQLTIAVAGIGFPPAKQAVDPNVALRYE